MGGNSNFGVRLRNNGTFQILGQILRLVFGGLIREANFRLGWRTLYTNLIIISIQNSIFNNYIRIFIIMHIFDFIVTQFNLRRNVIYIATRASTKIFRPPFIRELRPRAPVLPGQRLGQRIRKTALDKSESRDAKKDKYSKDPPQSAP